MFIFPFQRQVPPGGPCSLGPAPTPGRPRGLTGGLVRASSHLQPSSEQVQAGPCLERGFWSLMIRIQPEGRPWRESSSCLRILVSCPTGAARPAGAARVWGSFHGGSPLPFTEFKCSQRGFYLWSFPREGLSDPQTGLIFRKGRLAAQRLGVTAGVAFVASCCHFPLAWSVLHGCTSSLIRRGGEGVGRGREPRCSSQDLALPCW